MEVYAKAKATKSMHYADTLYNIGLAYFIKGEMDDAINFYREASEVYAKESIGYANTLSNLGLAYYNKGEMENAIDFYREALVVYKKA